MTYKAENAGRVIRAVDPRGTYHRCSQCGTVVPKTINIRTHHCLHCGFKTSRNLNSALEILILGLESVELCASENKTGRRNQNSKKIMI